MAFDILASDWYVVLPGEIYPVWLKAGTRLDGQLLEDARAAGVIRDGKAPAKGRGAVNPRVGGGA